MESAETDQYRRWTSICGFVHRRDLCRRCSHGFLTSNIYFRDGCETIMIYYFFLSLVALWLITGVLVQGLLLHGDAAFSGLGLAAEVMQVCAQIAPLPMLGRLHRLTSNCYDTVWVLC